MTDDTQEDDPKWTRPAILRREAREYDLTDKQKDALVAAVRNPDAGMPAIAEHAGVEAAGIDNLLKSMRRGIVGEKHHEGDYDQRLNQGTSDFRDETVKRRAVVDFLARHPGIFDADGWSYERIAEQIQDDLGVAVHGTYAYNIHSSEKPKIHRRREWYERRGREDEIVDVGDIDPGNDSWDDQLTVRDKLEEAGVTDIPDENLDGLATSRHAQAEGRKKGGRLSASGGGSDTATGDVDGRSPSGRQTRSGDADGGDGGSGASATATGTTSTQPASGDDSAAATESAPTTDDPGGETTELERGNARYTGPAEGINLAGDRPSSVLVGPEDDDSPDVTSELERIRAECGPFGEKAAERELNIDDRDALEHEIKVLRILVAQQGEYIDQLRRALDNMFVNVEAGFTLPTEEDDG